jgi:hypothetical protein
MTEREDLTLAAGLFDVHAAKWEAHVRASKGWTHFHLCGWRGFIEWVHGHECPYLAARGPNCALAGILTACEAEEPAGRPIPRYDAIPGLQRPAGERPCRPRTGGGGRAHRRAGRGETAGVAEPATAPVGPAGLAPQLHAGKRGPLLQPAVEWARRGALLVQAPGRRRRGAPPRDVGAQSRGPQLWWQAPMGVATALGAHVVLGAQ